MRHFIIASVLLSSTAFACPDLAGKYLRCQSEHSSRLKVEIQQKERSGAMKYNVNTFADKQNEFYRADGLPYVDKFTEPNTGVKIEITTTSNCNPDDSLKVDRTFAFDGKILGTYNVSISKVADELQMTNVFKSARQEVIEEIVCH